jgi:hypothetical protein
MGQIGSYESERFVPSGTIIWKDEMMAREHKKKTAASTIYMPKRNLGRKQIQFILGPRCK